MKISIKWLNNWVDLSKITIDELINNLESLGFEVEGKLSVRPNYKNIVVGQVKHIESIKDADRIRLTHVDIGTEELQIVCGAWNFNVGDCVAVAIPGSVIRDNFKIEKRSIKNVESFGMICSPYELDLWDDKDSILKLNEDLSSGQLLETCYESNDTILDVAITPNRGDTMSHFGLSREIATKNNLKINKIKDSFNQDIQNILKLDHGKKSGSTSYFGFEIEDIKIEDSPLDIRCKLSNVGVRPINNIVDATNYVLFDIGQPLHAFDRDKLKGPISVRKAKKGETIITLDSQKRQLNKDDVVIIDNNKPVALAGVMGGLSTQVTEKTKNVLIESANFETINILRTSRSLNLISEASIRFERGVDNQLQEKALIQFKHCLDKKNNNYLYSNISGTREKIKETKPIVFTLNNFEKIIGTKPKKSDVNKIFKGLFFDYSNKNDDYFVTPPSWRYDIEREIDIIEEIARHFNYDSFPSTIKYGNNYNQGYEWEYLVNISNTMVKLGFYESYNLSFISDEDSKIFTPERNPVSLINPLDDSQKFLRTTSCTHLLRNLSYNKNIGNPDKPLFEIGTSFENQPHIIDKNIPTQTRYLSFLLPEYISNTDKRNKNKKIDIYHTKSILDTLFNSKYEIQQITRPGMHSFLSYTILLNGYKVGWFGKISEQARTYFDLDSSAYLCEINLESLINEKRNIKPYQPISTYPYIRFDLSFEVDMKIESNIIMKNINKILQDYENESYVFDEYFDNKNNIRTLGFRIKTRSFQNTLNDSEVQELRTKIIQSVTSNFSANLRDNE